MNWERQLGRLAPMLNEDTGGVAEPFAEWFARVRTELPHLPECVAEHWIHRHWNGCSPYEFLPLDRLRFDRQVWTLGRLRQVEVGSGWRQIHSDVDRLYSPDIVKTPLARMMLTARTWPVPIIVLDNPGGLADRYGPMGRLRLIEGHLRFTYLHCLDHRSEAAPMHTVWLATVV
jgi:hypothetical protein